MRFFERRPFLDIFLISVVALGGEKSLAADIYTLPCFSSFLSLIVCLSIVLPFFPALFPIVRAYIQCLLKI